MRILTISLFLLASTSLPAMGVERDKEYSLHDHIARSGKEIVILARIDAYHQVYVRLKSQIFGLNGFDELEDGARLALYDTLLTSFQMIAAEYSSLNNLNPKWRESYPDMLQQYQVAEESLTTWAKEKGIYEILEKKETQPRNSPSTSGTGD